MKLSAWVLIELIYFVAFLAKTSFEAFRLPWNLKGKWMRVNRVYNENKAQIKLNMWVSIKLTDLNSSLNKSSFEHLGALGIQFGY